MTQLILPESLNYLAPTIVDDLVRVGSHNDGGYVLPHRLVSMCDTLISMGINDDWSFEEDWLGRNGQLMIHAYDHTISRRVFRRSVVYLMAKLLLGKGSIAELTRRYRVMRSYEKFFLGRVHHYCERINNRVDNAQDADFAKVLGRTTSKSLMLKVDIEGCEYRIVNDIVANSERILGLVIEFHETDPFRQTFSSAVKALQSCYELVHVHGNNYAPVSADGLPEAIELTFIRKGLDNSGGKRAELPLANLDEPNNPAAADCVLRFTASAHSGAAGANSAHIGGSDA